MAAARTTAARATALMSVHATCGACHGTGASGRIRARCDRCGAHWTPELAAAHLDRQYGGWWGLRWIPGAALFWRLAAHLPCGCHVEHLFYEPRLCRICQGAGTISHRTGRAVPAMGRFLS